MREPEFSRDLYRGTAADYDRYRVPYPRALVDDLLARAAVGRGDGGGRLLDLACGTGQIAFALHGAFAEVLAVDQEPEMVACVRKKAAAANLAHIHCIAASAEDLALPEASLDLVAIANAFHRLRRDTVAALAYRWLRPGGCIALLWSNGPQVGAAPWQMALAEVFDRWAPAGRAPEGWDEPRRVRPDMEVLRAAGFAPLGRHRFTMPYRWTVERLTGYAYSLSILSRAALGDSAPRFERELADTVGTSDLQQTMDFAYELARRPFAA